jgi:hypothetical protein
MKLIAGFFLIVSLLALSACSSTASSDPQAAAEQYLQAQGEGNWEVFCDLLVPEDQEVVYRGIYRQTKKGTDCASALNLAPTMAQAQLSETTRGVQIDQVKIEGDTATIEAMTPKGPTTVPMVKVDGQWKIDLGAGAK